MNNGLIAVIAAFFLLIVLAIFFFLFKSKGQETPRKTDTGTGGSGVTGAITPTCIPYTSEDEKRDIQAIRSKCSKNLLIPVVGVGVYNDCMQKGKSQLPPINNCL